MYIFSATCGQLPRVGWSSSHHFLVIAFLIAANRVRYQSSCCAFLCRRSSKYSSAHISSYIFLTTSPPQWQLCGWKLLLVVKKTCLFSVVFKLTLFWHDLEISVVCTVVWLSDFLVYVHICHTYKFQIIKLILGSKNCNQAFAVTVNESITSLICSVFSAELF